MDYTLTSVEVDGDELTFVEFPALGARHGSSTRLGGVSQGAFQSLNLGYTAGDEPAASAAGSTERPQAAGALLHVTVDITPQLRQALAAEVDARDRQLFVFARPANGPRMPLAARRLPADQLPIQLTLSDEDGMLPGRTLASAGSVIVGARISTGGNATASSGDLQGFSTAVDPNTQPRVTVVIDSRVP